MHIGSLMTLLLETESYQLLPPDGFSKTHKQSQGK